MDRKDSNIRKGIDASENRRRRAETTIELRKNKKEQGLAKRRSMASASSSSTALVPAAGAADVPVMAATVDNLPNLVAALSDPAMQLAATRGLRKLLSAERCPPVEPVLRCPSVLPALVAFLGRTDLPLLQFEAAWALTNIASTEHTAVVVQAGAVGPLSLLLMSAHPDSREQAAWCLGNIAGDSPALRDQVLAANAMDGLIANIDAPSSIGMLRNCTWALSNCCRGKPQADPAQVCKALPVLARLVTHEDKEVLMDACWALSYLSDGDDSRIQPVVASGVVPALVRLLGHENCSVITPALRTLGNIVSGNAAQTQAAIDGGMLQRVTSLMVNTKKTVRKETCWALSNVAAGTETQISQLLEDRSILAGVISLLRTDEWEIQKEAAWVVSNIATGGTKGHIHALVAVGGLAALVQVLDVRDTKVIKVALNGVKHILKAANDEEFVIAFEEEGGLNKLEALQEHPSTDVYNAAVELITKFFGEDGEGEDENTAPALDAASNTFTFGMANQPANFSFGGEGTHTKFNFGAPAAPAASFNMGL